MYFQAILNLLRSDGSIIINKELARKIGIDATIVYSELISKYLYFYNKGTLIDGYFYCTIENLEKDTTLTKYQQSQSIKILKQLNLIDVQYKGLPKIRYFKIIENEKMIFDLLSKDKIVDTGKNNGKTSDKKIKDSNTQNDKIIQKNNDNNMCDNDYRENVGKHKSKNLTYIGQKTEQLEVKKLNINNTNINNTNNNNISLIDIKGQNENKKVATDVKNKFATDSIEYQLSDYLYQSILKNDDKFKKPKLDNWAKQFDYMIRLDKRDVGEIKNIIDFAMSNQFWQSVILSSTGLRKNYTKLLIQSKQQKNQNKFIKNGFTGYAKNCSNFGKNTNQIKDIDAKILQNTINKINKSDIDTSIETNNIDLDVTKNYNDDYFLNQMLKKIK